MLMCQTAILLADAFKLDKQQAEYPLLSLQLEDV